MKKVGVVAVAVLLLAVAAWLIVGRGVEAGSAPAIMPLRSETQEVSPPAPETREVRSIRAMAAATGESKAEREVTAPAEDPVLRVLVIEAGSGTPVAGAEVAATDDADPIDEPRCFSEFGKIEALEPLLATFDDAPQQVLTDDRGIAQIETGAGLVVAARLRDLYGARKFDRAPRGEIRLSVQPGVLIAAKVVTQGGEPVAGIPVVLRWIDDVRSRGYDQATVLTRAPDGLAILKRHGVAHEANEEHASLSAWIDGTSSRVPPVRGRLSDLRAGPIPITLPPLARVDVTLLDSDGKRFERPSHVYVGLERALSLFEWPKVVPSPSIRVPVLFGRTSVLAPIGIPFNVVGAADDRDYAIQTVDALDPSTQVRAVTLRFPSRRSVLVGRLVNQAGEPIANGTFWAEMVTLDPRPAFQAKQFPIVTRAGPFETSSDGAFRIPSVERHSVDIDGLRIDFEVESSPGVVRCSGSAVVAALSNGPETNLGDVRLSPPEALGSGTVVDELGAPVRGAWISARPTRVAVQPESPTPDHGGQLPSGRHRDVRSSTGLGRHRA